MDMSLLALAGLLGLVIGSFCNVVIHRLPRIMEQEWQDELQQYQQERAGTEAVPATTYHPYSLSHPRSHCPHCQTTLRWTELVPVLSWLLQRGRCRHCRQGIRLRYPAVELVSALLALIAAGHFGASVAALASYGLLTTLLVAALVDWDSQWLPDRLTLPLLWAGLLLASLDLNPLGVSLHGAVWGAMAGYLSLWLVATLFRALTGKDGLGGGDTKLLAALGAWLGGLLLPSLILLASLIGLGIAFWFRWMRGQNGTFPFGPALAASGALLFCQQALLR